MFSWSSQSKAVAIASLHRHVVVGDDVVQGEAAKTTRVINALDKKTKLVPI